ncbi:MAG: sigma-70 family RNA polymerase sigma factor [Planctomycetes bacterium]|nr:sigma-70 family RNA polymerase sigma factor [Planctomycetota bacterium]
MQSDLSLIHAARQGDGHAFAQLVDRYANLLFRFALRFTSSRQAAEELAQDTLADFYTNLERYEPRVALGTYLCAILTKKALYARRKAARSPSTLDEPYDAPGGSSALNGLLQDEELARMKKLVDALDEPLRLVVELHYMEGLKLRQIADLLDVPLGTVKSRLNAALKFLRRGLADGGEP